MAATAGKKLRVKVATTSAGPYTAVVGIKSASMKRSGATIDVTTLADTDIVKILGLRDASYSLSGNWEMDTTGQKLIRDALANDTALFVQFLPDGGTTPNVGFQQEVKVASYDVSGDAAGEVTVSIELQGSGAITSV